MRERKPERVEQRGQLVAHARLGVVEESRFDAAAVERLVARPTGLVAWLHGWLTRDGEQANP